MMVDPSTTQVVTSDTSGGVAITFTTSADVNDLRARVRRMADRHNQMAGMHEGGMHGGHGGMHPGGTGMMMVPSRATAEDVPGGARVILVPVDASQLATLRDQTRTHVAMMQKGQCPMMAHPSPAPQRAHEHPPAGA